MSTIIDLLLAVRERSAIFYHKDTKQFDYSPVSKRELENLSFDERISDGDRNSIMLPSYKDIDHKEIMRFFARECVDDKVSRKQLFDILRRHEYMDEYLEKLHELDLYDDFVNACGDIYIQIFEEWADKNNLDFKKK